MCSNHMPRLPSTACSCCVFGLSGPRLVSTLEVKVDVWLCTWYLHGNNKIDTWAVFWINPSLCWKLCWQFLFHKLLHTSAFCLMVNNLNNSLIVWIQVWYICFTYSCNIKLCHVLGITALRVFCLQISLLLLLVLLRSLLDASSQTSSVVRIIFSSRNCIPGQVSFSTCIAL